VIALIASHTLGQLVGQRRSLLMVLLALVPVLVAALIRLLAEVDEDPRQVAVDGLAGLVLNLVLPLTALVFGTAALGQEIEDGTVVYLLAKPVARWRVVVGKTLAAWLATTLTVGTSAALMSVILLAGRPADLILPASVAAVAVGALAYSALFVCLSVRFGRALIIGLVYVFIWEAALSGLAPGTRLLSIRQYALSVAEALARTPEFVLDANLATSTAGLMSTAVVVVALWYAVRRLERFELREQA
jgi:ABC-2 type transport system permease protein